jgi:hypothetical protein
MYRIFVFVLVSCFIMHDNKATGLKKSPAHAFHCDMAHKAQRGVVIADLMWSSDNKIDGGYLDSLLLLAHDFTEGLVWHICVCDYCASIILITMYIYIYMYASMYQ